MRKKYLLLWVVPVVLAGILFMYWPVSSGKEALPSPQRVTPKVMQGNVGDIAFDPATDRADFKQCHTFDVAQYYHIKTTYPGGTQALRRVFLQEEKLPRSSASHNGYVTIRFLINCRGDTDRFRVTQIDTAYQSTQFDPPLVQALLRRTKALRGWQPGTYTQPGLYHGEALDSYYYLLFKIANGKVVDILP